MCAILPHDDRDPHGRPAPKNFPVSDTPREWWPVLASSTVLSLALLGDALIYAVLPVHAAAFGISLAWVGVLLSANRIVRVFVYGLVARLTGRVGLRRMCIAAAAGSVISTAMYGLASGEIWLLLARVLWGLSYAVLILATLAYAVRRRDGVGARIGWSRAVQRLGPIVALLAGGALTAVFGPRLVFVLLAVISALALPLAWSLPADAGGAPDMQHGRSLSWPRPMDVMFFVQGMGVDGVFAVSITLMLARDMALSGAVVTGGALLAMRHVGEAIAAPLFGAIADRFGAARVFAAAALMTGIGFTIIALGFPVFGALLMLVFRGALASLGPATVVQGVKSDAVVAPLARMQAWRDLGAAIGPVLTGFALSAVAPEILHAAMAALTLVALLHWRRNQLE
jgi:predicted MFS family arabinose efflux permease